MAASLRPGLRVPPPASKGAEQRSRAGESVGGPPPVETFCAATPAADAAGPLAPELWGPRGETRLRPGLPSRRAPLPGSGPRPHLWLAGILSHLAVCASSKFLSSIQAGSQEVTARPHPVYWEVTSQDPLPPVFPPPALWPWVLVRVSSSGAQGILSQCGHHHPTPRGRNKGEGQLGLPILRRWRARFARDREDGGQRRAGRDNRRWRVHGRPSGAGLC